MTRIQPPVVNASPEPAAPTEQPVVNTVLEPVAPAERPVADAVSEPVAPAEQPVVNTPPEPVALAEQPVADAVSEPMAPAERPVADAVSEPAAPTEQPVVNTVLEPVAPAEQPVVNTVLEPVAPAERPVVNAVSEPVAPAEQPPVNTAPTPVAPSAPIQQPPVDPTASFHVTQQPPVNTAPPTSYEVPQVNQLADGQKSATNKKRAITVILFITLIAVFAGALVYYYYTHKDEFDFTRSPSSSTSTVSDSESATAGNMVSETTYFVETEYPYESTIILEPSGDCAYFLSPAAGPGVYSYGHYEINGHRLDISFYSSESDKDFSETCVSFTINDDSLMYHGETMMGIFKGMVLKKQNEAPEAVQSRAPAYSEVPYVIGLTIQQAAVSLDEAIAAITDIPVETEYAETVIVGDKYFYVFRIKGIAIDLITGDRPAVDAGSGEVYALHVDDGSEHANTYIPLSQWLSEFSAFYGQGSAGTQGNTSAPGSTNTSGGTSSDWIGRRSENDSSYFEGNIGDTMRNVFFEYTVNSVYYPTSYEGITASSGNQLLVANVTVKNVFSQKIPMSLYDFQLQWGDGDDEFGYQSEAVSGGNLMPVNYELGLDESVTYDLLYEVPASATEFSISYLEVWSDDTQGDVFFVYFWK